MKNGSPELSVVMPAYNEEGGVADAVRSVQEHVFGIVPNAELIAVNDGSRDRTGAILDELAARDGRVHAVHKKNGGHGPALITGLAAARGKYIFLIDSDNQIPLESFADLWRKVQEGHDAAFGVRRVRNDARLRRALTRVIRSAITLLFGVRLRDANIPFKVFRRELWAEAEPLIPPDTLAPSIFFAVHAKRRGARIAFVEVGHRERTTGVVSIRRWKLIKFCARAFRQLLTFRAKLTAA
ncbi:MAG TPA: glycosyltransferase family 2 protein [Gemmatimonadaceae bacterium]|nr:glycosyltransferase family 2 protein [Gemmatimonadaceae bacterium]